VNDVDGSSNGTLLLSADDFGLVNVFNMPNPSIDASRSYCGHSEHVVRARFSKDSEHVFSIGGQDKALMQWKVKSLQQ
jgi:WD40 repeat protein